MYDKELNPTFLDKGRIDCFLPSSLCSAFPRGSSLLQTPPGSVFWERQRKRPVPLLVVSATGPPALQQRQQPNSQSVPAAARFSWKLGPSFAATPTRPDPPAKGLPAAWLLSITSQPVTPAAPADAQRQPQWQRGGPDHGEGGEEPVTLPQPAGGGGSTGSPFTAPTQVSVCSSEWVNEKVWVTVGDAHCPCAVGFYSSLCWRTSKSEVGTWLTNSLQSVFCCWAPAQLWSGQVQLKTPSLLHLPLKTHPNNNAKRTCSVNEWIVVKRYLFINNIITSSTLH